MVFFASALDPQGGHLVLPTLNILHYNLASPNPNSLSMAIPDAYRATRSTDSTPMPEPSPSGAFAPTKIRNSKAAGLHNNGLDTNLLIPPIFNLRACCSNCLQEDPGGGATAAYLFPILATLSASLSNFSTTVILTTGTSKSTAPSTLLNVSAYSSSGPMSTCRTNRRLPLPARPPIQPQIPPDCPLQPFTGHLHPTTLPTHLLGSISDNTHHRFPHSHTTTPMGSIDGNYPFSITIK